MRRASRNAAPEPIVLPALTTGKRKGAIIGLRWRDADSHSGRVAAARTASAHGAAHELDGSATET